MAQLSVGGVQHKDALTACTYPQVVAVGHQHIDFLLQTDGRIVVDELCLRVVDAQSVLVANPQTPVGCLANGIDHIAPSAFREVSQPHIAASLRHIAYAAHLGHHPQRAVFVPCQGVHPLVGQSGGFVFRIVEAAHLLRRGVIEINALIGAHEQPAASSEQRMNAGHLSFDEIHLGLASFYMIQPALASYIKTGADEFQADVILIAAIVGYMMLRQTVAVL